MDPFAIPADVEAIWRPLSDAEKVVAAARINQASRKIRREVIPIDGLTIDGRIEAGFLGADDVKDVVVEMVKRVMMSPGYIRQQSITIDGDSKSQTFDGSVSTGQMFITESEMRILMFGAPSFGAFTITPAGSSDDPGYSYSR